MKLSVNKAAFATVKQLLRAGALGTPEARKGWHATLGTIMRRVIQDHARAVWPTRHKTALRLGATPTGFLARGIDAINFTSEERKATVEITGTAATALARVDGPVTITPKGKKWLTIPAAGEAYGKRAGEFSGLSLIFLGKGKMALGYGRKKGEQGPQKVLFWLRKSVTLPQDRTLLPTDETFSLAVQAAGEEWLNTFNGDEGSGALA